MGFHHVDERRTQAVLANGPVKVLTGSHLWGPGVDRFGGSVCLPSMLNRPVGVPGMQWISSN